MFFQTHERKIFCITLNTNIEYDDDTVNILDLAELWGSLTYEAAREKIPLTPESESSDTVCSDVRVRLNTGPYRCAEIEV